MHRQLRSAHFGRSDPDPAEAKGTAAEISRAFADAYQMPHQRISAFVALPFASLNPSALRGKLKEIGRMEGATAEALKKS